MGTSNHDYNKGTTLFGSDGVLLFSGVLLRYLLPGRRIVFARGGTPLAHLLGNKTLSSHVRMGCIVYDTYNVLQMDSPGKCVIHCGIFERSSSSSESLCICSIPLTHTLFVVQRRRLNVSIQRQKIAICVYVDVGQNSTPPGHSLWKRFLNDRPSSTVTKRSRLLVCYHLSVLPHESLSSSCKGRSGHPPCAPRLIASSWW